MGKEIHIINSTTVRLKGNTYPIEELKDGKYFMMVGRTGYIGGVDPQGHLILSMVGGSGKVVVIITYDIADAAPRPPAMKQYNVMLRPDTHIAWLKRQPNASAAVRDALDLWINYMGGE